MVKQYPHFLFSIVTTPSFQDAEGFWTDERSESKFLSICREETDGRGQEVQTADGTYRKFTSLIQLPRGELSITEGTLLFVTNDPAGKSVRIRGRALKFDKGQLHSRLWL